MLKTGKEHLAGLRDGRVVYIGGEQVDDVTRHPAFRNVAQSIAAFYDLKADPARQPFQYPLKRQFVEPDWRRLPGYKDVSPKDWESALWQRQHSVKNVKELKEVLGAALTDDVAEEILRDQKERATMSILLYSPSVAVLSVLAAT